MLVAQSVLLRGQTDASVLAKLAGVDRGYGITAGLLLVVGFARVFHGIKGADFYLHNPWFYAKIGAFLLAAVLSIWPTLHFLRWRARLKVDPAFLPAPSEVTMLNRIVRFELVLVAAIFFCAARSSSNNWTPRIQHSAASNPYGLPSLDAR